MTKRIQVSTFLKELGEGISAPTIILGNDNERYILKNQRISDNNQTVELNCMFLNELLCSKIAEYMELPIPDYAIAELDKAILDNGPALRFVHRYTDGIHFASKEIPEVESNLEENYGLLIQMGRPFMKRTWNKYYEDIINTNDVSKLIAFDLLVANFDRYNNAGNLIIANTPKGRKIFTIDHGHAFFGCIWETVKMSNMRAVGLTKEYCDKFVEEYLLYYPKKEGFMGGIGEVFRAIERNVNLDQAPDHSFKDIVYKIEMINEPLIDKWFEDIPDSWYVDKVNQIGYYKHFLIRQKDIVRYLIESMAMNGAFTNYRGGNLQWIEKRAGTV